MDKKYPFTSLPLPSRTTASRLIVHSQQAVFAINRLQQKFKHLSGLPLSALHEARPTILIGSDQPHLITPVEPVRLAAPGPHQAWVDTPGTPAVHGAAIALTQCLFTSGSPLTDELHKHVEQLWKEDTLPHQRGKNVARSKQDKQALAQLEARTVRTDVDGVLRYASPLLRHAGIPQLSAPKESIMDLLRSTERRLSRNPEQADRYKNEMNKLSEAGVVREVTQEKSSDESWYIPHHLVTHNEKNRLVFNCSHQYLGQTLNQYLLSGPTLRAYLLGVLVRF